MDYELSYAGTPFLGDLSRVYRAKGYEEARKHEPLADLMDELERLISSRHLQDLSPGPPPTYPAVALALPARSPQDPRATQVKVGEWYYPTTAQRFSIFRGLATSSMVKAMLATTGGTKQATFVMQAVPVGASNAGSYKLSTSMYMLPPRPLGEADKKFDGLFLVTLVDERFYFGGSPVSLRPTATTTWPVLIDQCAVALGIPPMAYSVVPAAYGQPEPDSPLWCNFENAAILLDALATNVGKVVVRNFDGTYQLKTYIESQKQVVLNRGTNVVRVAGGDLFSSGNLLVAGDLTKAQNSVVPANVTLTFPKYVYGADPVPHFLNPRTTSGRQSVWYEAGVGDVHAVTIFPTSGGPSAKGLTGVSNLTIRTDAKALYATEALAASGMQPANASGLISLAMRVTADRYDSIVAAALDEVYPGTLVWTPEGLHDIVWTYSEKQGLATTRVMHQEWNVPTEEGQYAIPLNGSIIASGVGGRSVAQTWRDKGNNIQFGVNLVTAGPGMTLTKGQVTSGGISEAIITGGASLPACKTVALVNLALTGAQTTNGTSLTSGDRVLLSAQTARAQNGPAVVNGNTWTRPVDYPSTVSMGPGLIVPIEVGDVGTNSVWMLQGTAAVTVDTTPTTWVDIDKIALVKATESFNTGTIWLSALNQSFELSLGGAKATSNMPWTLDYADSDTLDTTGNPATVRGFTNGVNVQTLATGIATGNRYVQHFSCDNVDTVSQDVIFNINFNGTVRQQVKRTLAVGQSLHYAARRGWYIFPLSTTSGTDIENEGVNNQTGTAYTVTDSDRTKLVTFKNANPVTVTFPQAGFPTAVPLFTWGWYCKFENRGTSTVTINPQTSTVDEQASLILQPSQGCSWHSDGANYFTERGIATATGSFNLSTFTNKTIFNTGPVYFGSWLDLNLSSSNIYSWWTINILHGCTIYAGVPPVVSVTAPTAVVASGGGTNLTGTYYAKYTDVGADNAESAPSPESLAIVTSTDTSVITFTFPTVISGQTRNLYLTLVNGGVGTETLIKAGIASTTFVYTGAADIAGSNAFPAGKALPAAQPGGGPVAASCLALPNCTGEPYWSDSKGSALFDSTNLSIWCNQGGTTWRSIIGTQAKGDMIYGSADEGEGALLGIGADGSIMVVVSGLPSWVLPAGRVAGTVQLLGMSAANVWTFYSTGTCP